jgi:branched-chain amino acid transport system substrate-binding protein
MAILGLFVMPQLTGCGKDQNAYIEIGAILDLTGPVAPYGNWSLKGLELAEDEINSQDRQGMKVELIIEDGKSSPQDAVSAFNKLVNIDKVRVVIITTGSSSVLSVAPIANENNVILFTPAASAPEITQAGDYVFRNRLSGFQEVKEMANIAYNKLELRRGAILVVNNDFGQSYGRLFEQIFKRAGGEILIMDKYEQGSTDFRSQLTKIKKGVKKDFVYIVGYAIECGQILRQAKELGIKTRVLSTIGIESDIVIEIAKGAADGVLYTAPRYVLDDPCVIAFEEKYFRRYNEHSNMYSANSYDALKIIAGIIQRVGYDAEKIKNALYHTKEYPGVSGPTTFDENGDVIKPIMLKVIRNGRFEIFSED